MHNFPHTFLLVSLCLTHNISSTHHCTQFPRLTCLIRSAYECKIVCIAISSKPHTRMPFSTLLLQFLFCKTVEQRILSRTHTLSYIHTHISWTHSFSLFDTHTRFLIHTQFTSHTHIHSMFCTLTTTVSNSLSLSVTHPISLWHTHTHPISLTHT